MMIRCGLCFMTLLFSSCNSSLSVQEGIASVTTSNYANKKLEYYYHLPANLQSGKIPILICIPGLSGDGRDFVSREIIDFARSNSMAVIAPSFRFDEKNWNHRTSYQFPSVWSGDAMLSILDQFRSAHQLEPNGLYLFGASAGAQFCLRFALWKPEICVGCAAYGAGGSIIPDRHVDVSFLVGIGKRDTARIQFAEEFRDAAARNGIRLSYIEYYSDHGMPLTFISDSMAMIRQWHMRSSNR